MTTGARSDHPRLRRLLRVPGTPESAGGPQIVVLDLLLGRSSGGHHEDYVAAVLDALADRAPELWAPDHDGWGRPPGWLRRAQDIALAWLATHPTRGRTRVIVSQSPLVWELLTLYSVTLLARRRRAVAVFVLRRAGATGSRPMRLLARLSERAGHSLVRRRRMWPASDSRLALDGVEAATGVRGTLLPIPLRRPAAGRAPRTGPPVVSLLGAFRMEKGAMHYDAVLRAALGHGPEVELDVQVGEGQEADGSAALARDLRDSWGGHNRVRLHDAFLPAEEYDAIVARTDVVVLPYHVDAYGTGTSGILHEVLASGGVVLTTPIAWAASEYAGHPRVRFLHATDAETVTREVGEAIALALEARAGSTDAVDEDAFGDRWREAVAAAEGWAVPR